MWILVRRQTANPLEALLREEWLAAQNLQFHGT